MVSHEPRRRRAAGVSNRGAIGLRQPSSRLDQGAGREQPRSYVLYHPRARSSRLSRDRIQAAGAQRHSLGHASLRAVVAALAKIAQSKSRASGTKRSRQASTLKLREQSSWERPDNASLLESTK